MSQNCKYNQTKEKEPTDKNVSKRLSTEVQVKWSPAI